MKVKAFIFARGGSKGLPGKNIRPFEGRPLIGHSIRFALDSGLVDEVIVSTDDEKIADVARSEGARVPFLRPAELATDTAPEMLSWRHAVEFVRKEKGDFDVFVSLPAVSPLREKDDLKKGLELLQKSDADFIISAVQSEANPYFNLFEKGAHGFARSKTKAGIIRRQDAPPVFKLVPMFYLCRPDKVFKYNTVLEGKVELFEIPAARAIDIDTIEDFHYLEFLRSRRPS